MADKFVHDVSPTLTRDAQFRSVADIPSVMLTQGSTVRLWPGAYGQITTSLDNIAIHGMGDVAEVTIAGVLLGNTSANTITFRNLTINGDNVNPTSGSVAVEITDQDETASVVIRECVLATAQTAVQLHGTGTITIDRSDVSGCDETAIANAAIDIAFTRMSAGTNAYSDSGNAQIQPITIVSSAGGGSNGAITTEVVLGVIT